MFSVLDAVIVLLLLLFVFVGARRGFIGSLAKLLGGFIKLILSIILAKPLASLVSRTCVGEQMFERCVLRFAGISEKFNVNLVGMPESELQVFVSDALSDAKIPKMFRGFFQNIFSLTPEVIATKNSVTIAELMGVTVSNIILVIGSFLFLIIFFWLFSVLIKRWSKRNVKSGTIFAKTNKWLGAVFGFVKAVLILIFGFIILSVLSNFSFMDNIIDYVNNSIVSKFIFKLSTNLLETSFNFKEMLEFWLTN